MRGGMLTTVLPHGRCLIIQVSYYYCHHIPLHTITILLTVPVRICSSCQGLKADSALNVQLVHT